MLEEIIAILARPIIQPILQKMAIMIEQKKLTNNYLLTIKKQNKKIMDYQQAFLDLLNRLDGATSAIAQRINGYIEQLSKPGLTDAQAATLFNRMKTETATLEAMGKEPENPVPDPTPAPTDNGGTTPGDNGGGDVPITPVPEPTPDPNTDPNQGNTNPPPLDNGGTTTDNGGTVTTDPLPAPPAPDNGGDINAGGTTNGTL